MLRTASGAGNGDFSLVAVLAVAGMCCGQSPPCSSERSFRYSAAIASLARSSWPWQRARAGRCFLWLAHQAVAVAMARAKVGVRCEGEGGMACIFDRRLSGDDLRALPEASLPLGERPLGERPLGERLLGEREASRAGDCRSRRSCFGVGIRHAALLRARCWHTVWEVNAAFDASPRLTVGEL